MKKTFKSSRFCNIFSFQLCLKSIKGSKVTFWMNYRLSLISRFMTSQPGTEINVIHILPNILRKIITWAKFFFKNYTRNVVQKLVPDPFLKNENWAYLWINWLEFETVYFYCMPSWRLSKYIETRLAAYHLHLPHLNLF